MFVRSLKFVYYRWQCFCIYHVYVYVWLWLYNRCRFHYIQSWYHLENRSFDTGCKQRKLHICKWVTSATKVTIWWLSSSWRRCQMVVWPGTLHFTPEDYSQSERSDPINQMVITHISTYMIVPTIFFISGGARGVMVIVAGIGHGDTSSNPGLIAFHIALIPLDKVWIQLFSLQLWVNSRAD